jgi:hypothetical protein
MFKRHLLIIVLALGISPSIFPQEETLKFVIRIDDILSRNTTILPRSIVPMQDSISARGGKITWGVMPHRFIETPNLDGVLADELIATSNLGHEVSLHGYIHICQRCNKSSHEMYCTTFDSPFSYEQQEKLIQDGLELIDKKTQLVMTSFIPPGHISDTTTWKVLADNNISIFSDDAEIEYLNPGVFNLPINEEYTWSLTNDDYQKNLTDALIDIKETAKETGIYNLMLHDPFIRSGYEDGIVLRWMGELLDSLNVYYGSNIEYLTLTEAANSIKGEPVSIEEEKPNSISSFTLSQNYPNPFNPTTQISFNLNRPSKIKLIIFDTKGQVISALLNSQYSSGRHSITFDGSNLASGVYFFSLTVDGQVLTKKMSLIK